MNIKSWLEDCKSQSPKTIFTVLVGNKVDLDKEYIYIMKSRSSIR